MGKHKTSCQQQISVSHEKRFEKHFSLNKNLYLSIRFSVKMWPTPICKTWATTHTRKCRIESIINIQIKEKMNHKLTISIFVLLLSFRMFGQTEDEITKCENKICIDTLKSNFIIGKWYDFSPEFQVEQSNWILYYIKNPTDLTDSISYNGTITFKTDSTFEKTYVINEKTYNYNGTWIIPSGTRQLKLLVTTDAKTQTQTWTVLELNKDIFILKFGK